MSWLARLELAEGRVKYLGNVLTVMPFEANRIQIPRHALRRAQGKLGMTKFKLTHYPAFEWRFFLANSR
jgi:hypothetical protein